MSFSMPPSAASSALRQAGFALKNARQGGGLPERATATTKPRVPRQNSTGILITKFLWAFALLGVRRTSPPAAGAYSAARYKVISCCLK